MEIKITIPNGKSGPWEISEFEVSKEAEKLHNLRSMFQTARGEIVAGKYKKLTRNGKIIMSNTPAEIRDHSFFFNMVKKRGGSILINGLGLGIALKKILEYDNVTDVTVIENSEDVIELVGLYFMDDSRVNIVHEDAFSFVFPKGKRWNCVWHDIWEEICSDNLPEIAKLHRKYGKRTDWQGSWCRKLCENQRRMENAQKRY